MKRILIFLSTLSLGAAAHAGQMQAVPASVQQPPSFSEVDANNDGTIDRSEALKAGVLNEDQFKSADKNNDGKLSKDEYDQAIADKQHKSGMVHRQGS